MRIKRYGSLLLAVLLSLALSACGIGAQNPSMSILPAQLSAEEEALAKLLDVDMDSYHMFDFQLGSGKAAPQSAQLTTYELIDGAWEAVALDRQAFSDSKGRIALGFGKLTDGIQASMQGEGGTGTTVRAFTVEPEDDVSAMAYTTSVLSETADLEYDQETPLVVQIATTKNEIHSYDVKYFDTPQQYAKHGYEHVYAITVRFSQKTVYELEGEAANS